MTPPATTHSLVYARMYVASRTLEKYWTLPDNAYRLAWDAIAYSREKLTDGFISSGVLAQVSPAKHPKNAIAVLVERGLWEPVDGGWTIHDYPDWQDTKADVEAYLRAKSAAGAKGAKARWGHHETNGTSHG